MALDAHARYAPRAPKAPEIAPCPDPARATSNSHHRQPPILSADMTPAELIDVLEHLPFYRGPILLRVDRDVRDYLVRALQAP